MDEYKSLIVVVDDNPRILENFQDISASLNVSVEVFESWDIAQEYLEKIFALVDGIILDAKGKLTSDRQESEAHLQQALKWISKQEGKSIMIPFAIHTAFYEDLETFSEERSAGKMFQKRTDSERQVLNYLKEQIKKSPKLTIINQYPEPFQCFGGEYLDKQYETLLINIISIFSNEQLSNPENLLFNSCRILLEATFRKVTEVNERVLPYSLINFDRQRAGLFNCLSYLSGDKVFINKNAVYPPNFFKDSGYEFISKQISIIITVCHPASHEIQLRYTQYTFKSVLWALFDVLIWLKSFVDQNK
jgi:hypothetical protein